MILIPFLLAFGVAAAPALAADIDPSDCLFGEVAAFSHAACAIHISNHGQRPVTLALSALQPGDEISPASVTIPPGGSVSASVRVAIGNGAGETTHDFRIHRAGTTGRDQFAMAKGFVLSALDDPHASVAFGDVDVDDGKLAKSVELGSHDTAAFRVVRVIDVPRGIEARIDPDGRTVIARIRPDAPWGLLDGDIKLAIDTPRQKQAWVHVSGVVRGEIVSEKNPFWFGNVPAGHDRRVLVALTDRQGRDFRVGKVSLESIDAQLAVVPCQSASKACRAISVTFSDKQPSGVTRGELYVDFPDLHRQMHLRLWGILRPPDASGTHAEEEESAPWMPSIIESMNAPISVVPVQPSTADAATSAAKAANTSASPTPGSGPLLKWVAEDEKAMHGYQIFRADAEAGPFVLLNVKTIPADGWAGAAYQWRDTGAVKGRTYWYYIGIVATDGQKKALSKPLKTVAK